MKNTILVALALLPAAASAQVLELGAPALKLPTPFSIPTDPTLTFPSATPSAQLVPTVFPAVDAGHIALTPSVIPTAAVKVEVVAAKPALVTAYRPIALAVGILPAPLKSDSSKPAVDPKGSDSARKSLDEKFDGRKSDKKDPVVVSDSRHISLPERDLEAEIGAY